MGGLQDFFELFLGGIEGDDCAVWVDEERLEVAVELFPLAKELAVVAGMELCGGVQAIDAAELAKDSLTAIDIDADVNELGLNVVVLHIGNARLRSGRVPESNENIVATQLLQRERGVGIAYSKVRGDAAHRRFGGVIAA